jgi:hypothetical protein
MANYYWITWPRRLAAEPAWEYATNAETIGGRDGGLMPLRSYGEFFGAAVNSKDELAGGVTQQPPSQWRWPSLDLLGVRWFVTAALPPAEVQVLGDHGFRPVAQAAYYRLWERPAPPVARMQYNVDAVPDPQARVARLEAGYPLLTRAIVEQPVAGLERPTTPPRVQVVERGQTRTRVTVETATDGLLVLADPWYPQWRVEVGGKPAELLRVDHAFRGVRVPAGSHQVTFTYRDRALWLGAALALTTCLALAGVWAVGRRRARVGPAAAASSSENDAG